MTYKRFPLLVWVLTIVLGPILIQFYKIVVGRGSIFSWYEEFGLSVLIGAIFSLPALFAYFLAFNRFAKIIYNNFYLKLVMILFTTLCIVISFSIIGAGSLALGYIIIYSIANAIATFALKFNWRSSVIDS